MKKVLLAAALMVFSAAAYAEVVAIPVKLSLWDNKSLPFRADTLKGLEVGFGGNTDNVDGVQFELIKGNAEDVVGAQIGIYANTAKIKGVQANIVGITREHSVGAQISFVNLNEGRTSGAQVGIYNQTAVLHGAQVGFVNFAHQIDKGFQLGLVNISKKGGLPVMVIFNCRF